MTCVKTGCHIYIIPYGLFAYGDAHEVGGAFFFRLVETLHTSLAPKVHYEVNNFDSWWDKGAMESGNFVSTLVSRAEDVISYGYDGRNTDLFSHAN